MPSDDPAGDELICERCKKPIEPGETIAVIGRDPEARIVLGEDVIVIHDACPRGTP